MIVAIRNCTQLAMGPGIKRLVEISEDERIQEKVEQTLEHRQLLIRWVKLNYGRTAMALWAGLSGLWAIID